MDDDYDAGNYDAVTFYDKTYRPLSPYANKKDKRKTRQGKVSKANRSNSYLAKLKASAGYHEKHSCKRKVRHATEVEAIQTIEKRVGKELTFYSCEYCNGFHITTVRNEVI